MVRLIKAQLTKLNVTLMTNILAAHLRKQSCKWSGHVSLAYAKCQAHLSVMQGKTLITSVKHTQHSCVALLTAKASSPPHHWTQNRDKGQKCICNTLFFNESCECRVGNVNERPTVESVPGAKIGACMAVWATGVFEGWAGHNNSVRVCQRDIWLVRT